MYQYQKGDYESIRKDTLDFAKEKYFYGHSDTRSVQSREGGGKGQQGKKHLKVP